MTISTHQTCYLAFYAALFGVYFPVFVDHGRSAPRGADDPPAANLLCSQEIVQRDPQFHVAASSCLTDLRIIFTLN